MGFLLLVVVLVGLFGGAPRSGLDAQLASIVKPYQFSISGWQFNTILRDEIPSLLSRKSTADESLVIQYFRDGARRRALEDDLKEAQAASTDTASLQLQVGQLRQHQESLSDTVEEIIERQITSTLREQGIYSPFGSIRVSFPPVNFKLASTPNLLVVSPRDRIESVGQAMLQPELTMDEAEAIESRVDGLNVSSLVTGIGGLGATYPTFVANDMDLKATLDTSAHEWVHQYLAFKPLGFRYVLNLTGVSKDGDIACLNETVADIVGKEIANLVYDKYYKDSLTDISPQPSGVESGVATMASSFDFNAEMRQVRIQVDLLLSQGKVDEAEQCMNEKRDYLASHGYNIRKLNQAYFAFYGSYADSPMSVDPVGINMRELRSRSDSLKEFLDRVSSVTSERELEKGSGGVGPNSSVRREHVCSRYPDCADCSFLRED